MLDKNTYCTGTLRINLRENPKEVSKKKLKKGKIISVFKNGIHVGKWKDKREVMYITTEYESEMDIFVNKRGDEIQKPSAILEYNKYMSGVDHQDQLLSYYPCERKTIRWYKKLFIHVAQLLMLNSMKLYNAYSGNRKMTLYDFRLSVINSLLPIDPLVQPVRDVKKKHIISLITEKCPDKGAKERVKRKRCRLCSKEGRGRKQTTYECKVCEDKPGLCVQCFEKYHENL